MMEDRPKKELHAYLQGFADATQSATRQVLYQAGIEYSLSHADLPNFTFKKVHRWIQEAVEHVTNSEGN